MGIRLVAIETLPDLFRPLSATCLFLLLACLCGSAIAKPFSNSTSTRISAFLENRFTNRAGGMVIGIIDKEGSQIFSAGQESEKNPRKPDANTVFEIGSVTKTFTSLLALDMQRRGELKLSDPISRHLPGGTKVPKFNGQEITIHNLAAQDSGLPFNPDNFDRTDFPDSYNRYSEKLLHEFLADFLLTNAPGTRFQYSNTGMALLGHIMERISGRSFGQLVEERIAKPLAMNDTRGKLTTGMSARMSQGHDKDGKPHPNLELQIFAGAGNLKSTANDLLKYIAAQIGLRKTTFSALIKRSHRQLHESSSGFGNTAMPWVDQGVYQPTNSHLLGHAGGTGGFSSFVGFDLRQHRGVVVLSSDRSGGASSSIGWTILQQQPLSEHNLHYLVREVSGVGVSLAINESDGRLQVNHVFKHSSAGRAGLLTGTVIRSINGTSTENRSMAECLKLFGGKKGTTISLEIVEPGQKDAKTVTVTREKFLTSD